MPFCFFCQAPLSIDAGSIMFSAALPFGQRRGFVLCAACVPLTQMLVEGLGFDSSELKVIPPTNDGLPDGLAAIREIEEMLNLP